MAICANMFKSGIDILEIANRLRNLRLVYKKYI
jgi:hypothetical protein